MVLNLHSRKQLNIPDCSVQNIIDEIASQAFSLQRKIQRLDLNYDKTTE